MKRDRLIERIVAMLEAHVDQDAKIEHDVMLPAADGSESDRQCDVVVTLGSPPRQTISIVEVQARKTKPKIGEFDGWLSKLEAVGAQHLICVTEAGFPTSIEKKAKKIGPTVRLVTLTGAADHDVSGWINAVYGPERTLQNVTYNKLVAMQIESYGRMHINPDGDYEADPDPFAPMFQDSGGESVTPSALFDRQFFGNPTANPEIPVGEDISFRVAPEFDQGKLYLRNWDETLVPMRKLTLDMSLRVDHYDIEWSGSVYHQQDDHELGWVLRGAATLPSGTLDVVVPFRTDPDVPGQYWMGRPRTISNHDVFFSVGGKGIPAARIDDEFPG